MTETRQWVRLVDGKLVLTWQTPTSTSVHLTDDEVEEVTRLRESGHELEAQNLTLEICEESRWESAGTRPLTFWERVLWRLLARTPQP